MSTASFGTHSVDAFTPTLGFATKVVSVTVLLFFLLIGVVFWIASLHDRPDFVGAELVKQSCLERSERATRAASRPESRSGARAGT